MRDRAETPALDKDGLFIKHLAGLEHRAIRPKHRRTAQPELHELERHEPVVHVAKLDAFEINEINLDAAGAQFVEQALHELVGLVVEEKRAEEQIHADDAERLLLERRLGVQHAHMDDDLARLIVRMRLEFYAHPTVALVAALEAARHHGIGESEERSVVAAALAEPVEIELKLVIEHRLQPVARHIALGLAVDRVAHRHVVGRHALRDRPRRPADAEKPAHHLLSGADLGKGAVKARVEIDPERLLMRIDCAFGFHHALRLKQGGCRVASGEVSGDFRGSDSLKRTP